MMVERLAWREVILWMAEQFSLLLLLLLPRSVLVCKLQALAARQVFSCRADEITLYKSGRAALHGVFKTLRFSDPRRTSILIPDYICNVVARACCAAGFSVRTYSTTETCMPVWAELQDAVRTTEAPVVLLSSLFGSVPVTDERVKGLLSANEQMIIVADECQNLIPDSGVRETPAHVIVFSFNDKTCPGVMGGGAVWSRGAFGKPFVEKAPWQMRWKCRVGLLGLCLSKMRSDAQHILRVCFLSGVCYTRPTRYEYSQCQRAHYDLRAEAIYKLSAARAIISVRALARYRNRRVANIQHIQRGLGADPYVNVQAALMAAPPFVPVRPALLDTYPDQIPFPLKAPYASTDDPNASIRPFYSIMLTTPFVRFVDEGLSTEA